MIFRKNVPSLTLVYSIIRLYLYNYWFYNKSLNLEIFKRIISLILICHDLKCLSFKKTKNHPVHIPKGPPSIPMYMV